MTPSKFSNTKTVEQIKAENGNLPFAVIPNKETGKTFFACGALRGYVPTKLAEKFRNHEEYGTLVVSQVDNEDSNYHGLMLHEVSTANAVAVF